MPTSTTNYSFQKPLVNDPTDEDLWGGYLNDDLDDIDSTIKTVADEANPIGVIQSYSGTAAPTKWLLCYGQAVSRVTYASLFAITSTTYGVGDGATTFNLPDLRGRVIAGQDDMGGSSANRLTGLTGGIDGDVLGGTGGVESHTLTAAQIPELTGTVDGATAFGAGSGKNLASSGTGSGTLSVTVNAGSVPAAHNIVQPTIILNYIIYAGV